MFFHLIDCLSHGAVAPLFLESLQSCQDTVTDYCLFLFEFLDFSILMILFKHPFMYSKHRTEYHSTCAEYFRKNEEQVFEKYCFIHSPHLISSCSSRDKPTLKEFVPS